MTTHDGPCSRRTLLKRSAAVGLTGALAGCLDALPVVGGGSPVAFGSVEAPEPTAPYYRQWLPAADAVPPGVRTDRLATHPALTALEPGALGGESLGATYANYEILQLRAELDFFGSPLAEFDRVVQDRLTRAVVLEGDVSQDAVVTTLTETGYERDGSHDGVDLFTRDDNARTVGVTEHAMVFSRGVNHGTVTAADHRIDDEALVRAVADAGRGGAARRHETVPAFAALTEAVGGAPFVSVAHADDPRRATAVSFDRDAAYVRTHLQYPEAAPDAAALREEIAESPGFPPGRQSLARRADRVAVTVEGAMATVAMRLGPDAVAAVSPDATVPIVTWGVEHDQEGERLVVRHEGGTAIPMRDLAVGPEGQFGDQREDVAVQHSTVEPGDAIELDLAAVSGTPSWFRLFYEPFEGDVRVPLFRYTFDG